MRDASPELQAKLEAYTNWLEDRGHEVHLPHRDTDQTASGLEICMQNGTAIMTAEEIHIIYDEKSQGSHFDLGMVFASDMLFHTRKRIRPVELDGHTKKLKPGKSFRRMIDEWIHAQNEVANLYPCLDEALDLDCSIPFETF